MMKDTQSRIYLSPPHMSGFEQEYISEAFTSNWIAPLGPNVDAFEKEIAEYVGVSGAVALSSGTAAIHLALRLLGVANGDRVFCSSLTFIGSVSPILYQGAEPVFIDSEPENWNMSAAALEQAFIWAGRDDKLPKAVVIVDLYGQSADYDRLLSICNYYGVPVIEDAAEAMGASYKGKPCGTMGKYGIFSFNGNKIITTSGGGILISNDIAALEKSRFLATQARDPAPYYQHSEIGYNYRMSNILAGIGRGQLKVLQERVNARRKIFELYYNELKDIEGVSFMPEAEYGTANRWLTVMNLDQEYCKVRPGKIMDALERENIESRPVWKPMHLQPLFAGCRYFPHDYKYSVSDLLFNTGLCLPSGSSLTTVQQQRVIYSIKNVLSKFR